MLRYTRIFFVGMMVSFIGSLPLGTLNIAAMQIAITDGKSPAIGFAIGILLVEIIYVRISLVAMDKIRRQERVLRMLEWITVIIILALALFSFIAATHDEGDTKNVLLSNDLPRFVLGVLMSAVNPVQIPFWFGWSTVLFAKKILLPQNDHYNVYILGIGSGTFLGTCIFIFGGQWMVNRLNASQNTINYVIGSIFLLTALLQLYKILRKKDAVQKIFSKKA